MRIREIIKASITAVKMRQVKRYNYYSSSLYENKLKSKFNESDDASARKYLLLGGAAIDFEGGEEELYTHCSQPFISL